MMVVKETLRTNLTLFTSHNCWPCSRCRRRYCKQTRLAGGRHHIPQPSVNSRMNEPMGERCHAHRLPGRLLQCSPTP